jgi:hypothetical protein
LSLREPPSLFFSNRPALKRVRPLKRKMPEKLKRTKLQESVLWQGERPGSHGLKDVIRTFSRSKSENAPVCSSGEESREK